MRNNKRIALVLIIMIILPIFTNIVYTEKKIEAKTETGVTVLKLDENGDDEQGLEYTLNAKTNFAKVSSQRILDIDAQIQIPDAVVDKDGTLYQVNELADDLFVNCSMIKSLRLSESLQKFNFSCLNKSSCQELYLGQNASTIFPGATQKIENISVSKYNTSLAVENGVLFNKEKTVLMKAPYSMENVTTYEVPVTVKHIYDYAFSDTKYAYHWETQPEEEDVVCELGKDNKDDQGLTYEYQYKTGGVLVTGTGLQLEEVVIPDYVIYNWEDGRTSQLRVDSVKNVVGESTKRISIGANVKTLAENLFSDAHCLEKMEVDPRNNSFCTEEGGLYSLTKDIIYRIPVSTESFIFPEEVSTVAPYCFAYTNLGDVRFDANKFYDLQRASFMQCSITHIFLPNVKRISSKAFEKCTKLKWVVLGNRQVELYADAFRECTRLEAVFLPQIHSLDYSCEYFYNCVSLKTCVILNGINVFGQTCFYGNKIQYMVLPQECEKIVDSVREDPIPGFQFMQEIYFPKNCHVNAFFYSDNSSVKAYYPAGGTTESEIEKYNYLSKRVTWVEEKDHEHTYENHDIYDANGLTISAERCTDCYKQVSYRAKAAEGEILPQYDFYREPVIQSIMKNHGNESSDTSTPTISPTPSARVTPTASPTASAGIMPTVSPTASAGIMPTVSPTPNAKETSAPVSSIAPTANNSGNQSAKPELNKGVSQSKVAKAKKSKLKITPVISVKKKRSGKIKYIHIHLKKYQGTHIEIYAGKKNKLRKIGGKAFSIKKYKKILNVKYSKKKQVLYVKVRTYKKVKNKRIYSRYSKTIKVRT